MLNSHRLLVLPFLWVFLAISTASNAEQVTIAEARNLPLSTTVSIQGRVVVPSGLYKSAMFDEGFQIHDITAGIYVSVPTNLDLKMGQQVLLTGTKSESYNLQVISTEGANVRVLPEGSKQIVPTGSINESTEGHLLTVEGFITRPLTHDLPFGYKVYIDDGSGELQIFIHASVAFDPASISYLKQENNKIRITGVSAQFADEYEITPRFRKDIRYIVP